MVFVEFWNVTVCYASTTFWLYFSKIFSEKGHRKCILVCCAFISISKVGYHIPVPDFYLVLHGLRYLKNNLMDSSISQSTNQAKYSIVSINKERHVNHRDVTVMGLIKDECTSHMIMCMFS